MLVVEGGFQLSFGALLFVIRPKTERDVVDVDNDRTVIVYMRRSVVVLELYDVFLVLVVVCETRGGIGAASPMRKG